LKDKREAIPATIPPILGRLAIDPDTCVTANRRGYRLHLHFAAVRASAIQNAAATCGKAFFKGLQQANQLFPEPG